MRNSDPRGIMQFKINAKFFFGELKEFVAQDDDFQTEEDFIVNIEDIVFFCFCFFVKFDKKNILDFGNNDMSVFRHLQNLWGFAILY